MKNYVRYGCVVLFFIQVDGATLTITNKTPFSLCYQCIDWANMRTQHIQSGKQDTLQSLSGISCRLVSAKNISHNEYQNISKDSILIEQKTKNFKSTDVSSEIKLGSDIFGVSTAQDAEISFTINS
jgi:hypothetical protein